MRLPTARAARAIPQGSPAACPPAATACRASSSPATSASGSSPRWSTPSPSSGYNATTVAKITKAAAVSRRTFYEQFADKQDCFLAAYAMIVDHLFDSMRAAAGAFAEWPEQVRAALATLLRFFAAEPELARFVMIEPIAAGGKAAERHRETMRRLAEIVRAGRPRHAGARPLPEAVEETLVGGIVSLIVREIEAGRTEQLESLLPDLLELTLAPYLGAEQAAEHAGKA